MRRRRRVLGLFPSLDEAEIGGVQTSGRLAWATVRTEDIDSHLFCYGGPCGKVAGHGRQSWAVGRAATALEAAKGGLQADLTLIWHIGLLKVLALPRVKPGAIALFLHGVEAWSDQSRLTERLLANVDLFLSNSEFTWQRFCEEQSELQGAHHQVVHLGLGEPLGRPPPVPDERPIALMLGRLLKSEDYKGHREMIDAWPAVRLQVPDAELWVAGDGNLRSELQNFVKELGMSSCIRFLGSVSEEEKLKLLQQARCLTLPSRGEGFGLVYLEAMRIGRPCLVSILDAGREVVGPPEAGMEVDPRDANALTEAVCQLLTPDESWRQVSLAAQARYESRFTAEHFQSRLSTALEPWLARS